MNIIKFKENIRRPGMLLCIGVVLVSSFLFLFRLGSEAIIDYDEGIYAQVIDRTVESGDLLTLKMDKPWFEKPPLYMWAAMVSEKLFSSSEFSLRLPSALAGILTVIVTMLIAYEITGNLLIAALAGAILSLTGGFVEAGRQLRLDVPVTLAVVFSFYSFLKGQRRPWWYVGVGIGMGIGFMTKSVIGLLALPLIFFWAVIRKEFSWLKNKFLWIGIVLMLVIILPWHIYETIYFGSQLWDYFLHQILGRLGTNVTGGTVSNMMYARYLLTVATPWIIIFIIASVQVFRNRKSNPTSLAFFSIILAIFLIATTFFLAKGKLAYYLVPVFPLIALVCSYAIYLWYELCKEKHRVAFLAGLVIVLFVGLGETVYVGFHFQKDFAGNRIISSDEKEIGLYLLANPTPKEVFTYAYTYWDTIRYYSKGRPLQAIKKEDVIIRPFFLIISTHTRATHAFPSELERRLTTIYSGQSTTLLRFEP